VTVREFVEAYQRVRLAEGFASTDPAFAAALPFRDLSGKNRAVWRVRALHYLLTRLCLRVVPGVRRVLDLGAGNGWMARRLAGRFDVVAMDIDAGPTSLGGLRDSPVPPVRGELERLPFRDGCFDAVVAAAALHYSSDVAETLREVARVLSPRGVLVITDSPIYPDAIARARAARRTQEYYRVRGEPLLASRYHAFTRSELDGQNQFRFVTLAAGASLRGTFAARFRGAPRGARLPVLFGWRR
jgi:SAM-dependent methyltransferase